MSGLAMAHHIVDLKLRLMAHQRVLGAVKVAVAKRNTKAARLALEPVHLGYDAQGQPLGRLLGEIA